MLIIIDLQKFKYLLQIVSIHFYDTMNTMNTMKYSKIFENIDFF